MTDDLHPLRTGRAEVPVAQSDLAILRRMAAGDESALAQFIVLHTRRAYIVAKRILGDTATIEDIEEILADVFLHAWSRADRYEPDKGSVPTWLSWIVVGHALTRRRSILRFRRLRTALLAHPSPEVEPSRAEHIDDALDAQTQLEDALSALRALDPPAAELILRRYIAEESAVTIAKALGLTATSVRVRLHRAVRRLRALLSAAQS